jgi:hypothetical protein
MDKPDFADIIGWSDHAASFNADYINWIPLDKEIKNIILVKEALDDDSTRRKEKPLFDSVFLAGKNIIHSQENKEQKYFYYKARKRV